MPVEFKKALPYCCDKKLEPDYPASICPVCKKQYNSDDIVEIMLLLRDGHDAEGFTIRER